MDHTLADARAHASEPTLSWVRAASGWPERLEAAGLDRGSSLGSRELGEPIVDHRSSWVRRATIDSEDVYIKTYDYPTARDRRRGIGRTTALARSRAAREWDALSWLRAKDFATPQPIVVGEQRRLGLLHRAILVTAAWPGRPADQVLPTLEGAERRRLLDAIRSLVDAMHRAGFRDRNLDLRNLLVRQDVEGWTVTKIDSPRYRLRRPGTNDDRLIRADHRRLSESLRAIGID